MGGFDLTGELSVTARVKRLLLRVPIQITGFRIEAIDVVIATVTRDGMSGEGEASEILTLGITAEAARATIAALAPTLPIELSRHDLRRMLGPGPARNALDCALWDLEAKESATPVWALAGLVAPQPCATSFTIGADTPAAMASGAKDLFEAKSLKLKLTGDCELDAARVSAVRSARPDAWIGVDVNQGYTPSTFAAALPAFVAFGVSMIEQPLARGREADMDRLNRVIPFAADESCQDLVDLNQLDGRFDIVNIKLDKCGGLTEALMMVDRAGQLGLTCMVGNMIGTGLAMAPAALLAQRCKFADLDGAFPLASTSRQGASYRAGELTIAGIWGDGAAPTNREYPRV